MSSVAKRTRSHSEKDSPTKRFKADVKEVNEELELTTTTVLNLNDDCLMEVFSYLNQKDLVNVRLTNSRFTYASENLFTRNYSKSQAIASMIQGNRTNADVLKSSMDLLQAFGHLMANVLMKFRLEDVEELLDSMSNCGENIKELDLCHFGVTHRPGNAYYSGMDKMNSFLGGLNFQFPKLEHLKLEYRNSAKRCPYIKSLARHMPSLKSVTISGALFSLDDIREFFESNHQVESLTLIGQANGERIHRSLRVSQDFLNDLDTALPQLKMLQISRVYIKPRYGIRRTNRFPNLKTLTIGSFTKFTYFDATDTLSFTGENIEEISAYLYLNYWFYEFSDHISRFAKIARLVLHLLEIESELSFPDLDIWSLQRSLQLIAVNNSLTEVVINLYHPDENGNAVAHDNLQYLNLIKSVFNTVKWSMNDEDANRLVFTKVHQN